MVAFNFDILSTDVRRAANMWNEIYRKFLYSYLVVSQRNK